MGYSIEGDFFEACTCNAFCPCAFLNPATLESCQGAFAWHIAHGEMDGLSLAELNVAMAFRSPRQMTDGGWTIILYLDDRASPRQVQALSAIFSGRSGGHLAALVPLIGEVEGVHSAAIEFVTAGARRELRIDGQLEFTGEELRGMDPDVPTVVSNPPLSAVAQPLRLARIERLAYSRWSIDISGKHGAVTEFRYGS